MKNLVGIKHLVKCSCVLPQFKNELLQHQFVVFSIIEDDVVKIKYAQCNNCGIIHKVIDLCKSEITKSEHSTALVDLDDIKISLPKNLVIILEKYDVDLPTWEQVKFYFDNKLWGNFIILVSENLDNIIQGKYLVILNENTFNVKSFSRETVTK